MAKQYTLGKSERLKSRKQIEQLFNSGQRFMVPPYRIFYSLQSVPPVSANKPVPVPGYLQAGFSASSRNFKTAVARNRIKRLTKEVYRLQKNALQERLKEQNRRLNVFFIYTGKELPVYAEVYKSIGAALAKLLGIISKNQDL